MEVRDLFHALQRFELFPEPRGVFYVSIDRDLDPLGLRREAEGEVRQSEAREVIDLDLAGRKRRGLVHPAGLPGNNLGNQCFLILSALRARCKRDLGQEQLPDRRTQGFELV
jgi:hypothetical protein